MYIYVGLQVISVGICEFSNRRNMNKNVLYGIFSKSCILGRRVHTCNVPSVLFHGRSNTCRALAIMQVLHVHQKPSSILLKQLKYFCTSNRRHVSENDSDFDATSESDSCTDSDVEENCSKIHRHLLYPQSVDPIILKLRDSASVQDVFDIVTQHESEFSGHHACQAVLVLWDQQGMYDRVKGCETDSIAFHKVDTDKDYVGKLISHQDFNKIVHCIEHTFSELSADSSSFVFLYFRRVGIPFHSSVMQKLLFHIERLLEKENNLFPISALSRFITACKTPNFFYLYAVQKALPVIYSKIGSCESEDDLYLLNICMKNVNQFISHATLNAYKYKVEELIGNGILSTFSNPVIIKTALFLSNPFWCHENADLCRKLLLLLEQRVKDMSKKEIIQIHKVIQNQQETVDIRKKLSERAFHLFSEENCASVENKSLSLFTCIASSSSPKERKMLEELIPKYMLQELNPNHVAHLFYIMRCLRISDIELCDKLWLKTLDVVKRYPNEHSYFNIGKYSNRYMHFNNNLGGTYRHREFEKQMIEWYLHHYETGIIGFIPSKLVNMISFLVAYSDKRQKYFYNKLEELIVRLSEMSSQLTAKDCQILSRGIQIAELLQTGYFEKGQMRIIIMKLNSILNTSIEKHVLSLDDKLMNTNIMMRSYVMRRAPQTTDIFQCLVTRYNNFSGSVNSRLLRDAARNLLSSRCLIPNVIDRLTEFVIQNGMHLFGETVEVIIFLCYYLGYSPSSANTFFEVCSEAVLRDIERMPGLAVIQSGLSLCYFHCLPAKLVQFIFTIDFLERLDQEIANCYAKAVYPLRVRNNLMQLNRAVCLDYPEYDVPWFHKKYCEERASMVPAQTSKFYSEVKEILIDVLGVKHFVKTNTYSPYGYKIDFEFLINKNHVPVSWKHRTDVNISRKAVLLLKDDVFSINMKSINGYNQMKKRHLEILGYEVLEVEQSLWNSMYMSEPGMKYQFLREKALKNDIEKMYEMLH